MKRRDFLRASAAGGAAALGASVWTRRANAVPFGEIPSDKASSMLPENLRAQSVLECFLYGGLIPWETYYARPHLGENNETFAYTNYPYMIKAAEGCLYADAAINPFTYFAKDSAGQEIFFGPYMGKLMERQDVMKRLRIVINRHALSPHEAAIPLVASGRSLGNPSLAGLATHVNRYFVDRDAAGAHPPPFAYGFAAGSNFIPNDGVLSLVAQGLHPGSARPLNIKLDSAARLFTLLNRTAIGTLDERKQYDALMNVYFQQYSSRLKLGGSGASVRAAKFSELLQSSITQSKTEIIQSVLAEDDFKPWITDKLCEEVTLNPQGEIVYNTSSVAGVPAAAGNLPAMALRLATHLLTDPTYPARHATVVDVGIRQADGGGGYDTHSNGPWRQATNFNNFIKHLLSNVNEPGENNPRKIDLDKTMVILNSEFGRAPGRQSAGNQGRNHWPQGFAQIYIGGPIREEQAGIYGSIDEAGVATTFTTPAENRIAALLALGIYPFDAVAFSGSDAQGQTQEGPAARSIIERVLGHKV
jgi:hypothetical protein